MLAAFQWKIRGKAVFWGQPSRSLFTITHMAMSWEPEWVNKGMEERTDTQTQVQERGGQLDHTGCRCRSSSLEAQCIYFIHLNQGVGITGTADQEGRSMYTADWDVSTVYSWMRRWFMYTDEWRGGLCTQLNEEEGLRYTAEWGGGSTVYSWMGWQCQLVSVELFLMGQAQAINLWEAEAVGDTFCTHC